eukprot:COSAG01_NODE_18460_length_1074_cov_1.739487_1_plen_252_part_10
MGLKHGRKWELQAILFFINTQTGCRCGSVRCHDAVRVCRPAEGPRAGLRSSSSSAPPLQLMVRRHLMVWPPWRGHHRLLASALLLLLHPLLGQRGATCVNQMGRGAPPPTIAGCRHPYLQASNATPQAVAAVYIPLHGYSGGGTLDCLHGSWAAPVQGGRPSAAPRCLYSSAGCADDASWRSAPPSRTPCSRVSWALCDSLRSDSTAGRPVPAYEACPAACATCEAMATNALTRYSTAQCTDDTTWKVHTGL